jgi:hypothetical protein
MPLPVRSTRSVPSAGAWTWIALAVASGAVVLIVGLAGIGRSGPSSHAPTVPHVQPIPNGATPASEARNLSGWLRAHSH